MGFWRQAIQGGSTIVYWVVGVILVIGLIVAVNQLQSRGEQVRDDKLIASLDEPEASGGVVEVIEQEDPSSENQEKSDNKSNQVPGTNQELPQTGSEVWAVLSAGLLTWSVLLYIRSNKSPSLFD